MSARSPKTTRLPSGHTTTDMKPIYLLLVLPETRLPMERQKKIYNLQTMASILCSAP